LPPPGSVRGGTPSQRFESAAQQFGVPGKLPRDFRTDLAAIHVNPKVAVAADPCAVCASSSDIQPSRRAARIVHLP
jgi:hypothetical protein